MSGYQRKAPHSHQSNQLIGGDTSNKGVIKGNGKSSAKHPNESKNISHRVPVDVVMHILNYYATLSPSCAVNALLISKEFNSSIESGVYGCVSLFSIKGMESFLHLIKQNPKIAKKVNALWIAPGKSDSELISALTPSSNNPILEARQKRVQTIAREILRSCRRLRHLALDGGFVTPQCAAGFGTACKPLTLLCVNPHSFLGHFSAPIFRFTIQRLEVVDTTLAVEEIDEIRQMSGLKKFIWTSPRAKADVTRDVSVLLRILSPRAKDILNASDNDRQDGNVQNAIRDVIMNQTQTMMEALTISGTALPEKARTNDKLQTICTATSQARAAALAATFKKVVEEMENGKREITAPLDVNDDGNDDDDDVSQVMKSVKQGSFYVDSSRANSSSIHPPSGVELQTSALSSLMQALSNTGKHHHWPVKCKVNQDQNGQEENNQEDEDDEEIVDEWEALRDLVCQRKYSTSTPLSRYFANVGSGNTIWSGGSYLPSSNENRSIHSSGYNSIMSGSGANTPSLSRHEDEIDGGKALQRIWHRWLDQVAKGDLDRDL